jgi:hypothetical protein
MDQTYDVLYSFISYLVLFLHLNSSNSFVLFEAQHLDICIRRISTLLVYSFKCLSGVALLSVCCSSGYTGRSAIEIQYTPAYCLPWLSSPPHGLLNLLPDTDRVLSYHLLFV